MNFWRFMDGTYEPSAALPGSYDPWLVLLSILVASMAGYAALNVAAHIGTMETRRARRAWLAVGALAMGTGVWAMHFIGMLAFAVPIRMDYDLFITLVSGLPAVIGSGLTLAVMSRSEIRQRDLWIGSLFMATGIGAMHYTGMTAAYFFPGEGTVSITSPMDTMLMVSMIALVAMLVLGITIYGIMLDNWRRISLRGPVS